VHCCVAVLTAHWMKPLQKVLNVHRIYRVLALYTLCTTMLSEAFC